jgi:uncharacterized cupredoxin-like copper-binding protein
MVKTRLFITRAVLIGTVTAFASLQPMAYAHDAAHFSAGEPGDPKKSSRAVLITMKEGDGKMLFVPDRLEVRRNEQVRFILTNVGVLDHEFLLATTEENLKHAEEMKKNPDMEHDDPNGKRVAPKKNAEIVWKFTKVGEFEYGCLIPGHREAGMFGKVIVK